MKSFDSIEAFCRHLEGIKITAYTHVSMALRDAGRLVQQEAQHEIGTYQEAVGPFPAWPQLSDATMYGIDDLYGHHPGKIELGFAPPDNPLLATGTLRHAIELSYDATKAVVGVRDEDVGSGDPGDHFRNIGDVAVDHEFGTSRMPARPFLGPALFRKARECAQLIGFAAMAAVAGEPFGVMHRAKAAE